MGWSLSIPKVDKCIKIGWNDPCHAETGEDIRNVDEIMVYLQNAIKENKWYKAHGEKLYESLC